MDVGESCGFVHQWSTCMLLAYVLLQSASMNGYDANQKL